MLAGISNFFGAVAAALFFSGVSRAVYLIVDFGEDSTAALSSVFAGMCAVVVWSVIAFLFGIPTSESHALISGIVGAALGAGAGRYMVRFSYLGLVLAGLLFSTLPAYFIAKWIYSFFLSKRGEKGNDQKYFMLAQKFGVATSGFLHGAQDSQKFVGVIMLGMSLCSAGDGGGGGEKFSAPLALSLLSAAVMTAGTFIGGGRIIKKVGEEMVSLDAPAGVASDAASSIVLFVCTLLGIPVSTTHSKTSAMMGAGSLTLRGLDKGVARQMIFAWVLTFPLCALLGFFFGWILRGA